jgi:hypothetical protein
MSASYNANQDVRPVRRYFTGTTVLRAGQVLCYDPSATKTDADPKLRLGSAVQAISASNKKLIAGIVSDSSAGLTGPCFVEVVEPQSGDMVDAEVDGTTDVAAGDPLVADNTKGALIKGAAGDPFLALEANTTDSTKTVNRVYKI